MTRTVCERPHLRQRRCQVKSQDIVNPFTGTKFTRRTGKAMSFLTRQ